jgi:protein TonB
MLTSLTTVTAPAPRSRTSTVVSVAAHIVLVLGLGGALHHSARFVAPYRLPGSEAGHNFVVAYLPNRAPDQSSTTKTGPHPADPKPLLPVHPVLPAPPTAAASTASVASPDPDAASGADALGSGNIQIALPRYFPTPKPDLSVLPRGTHGDVILAIVIDTQGHISDLTMTSGVGYGVDEIVIATAQQWTFQPASQNGHPVASRQELHFHYERG